MPRRKTTRERIVEHLQGNDILQRKHPGVVFCEDWIYVNHLAKSRYNTDEPQWTAQGRIPISILRYETIQIYGQDTMKECAKGIEVEEVGRSLFEAYPKSKFHPLNVDGASKTHESNTGDILCPQCEISVQLDSQISNQKHYSCPCCLVDWVSVNDGDLEESIIQTVDPWD